MSDESPTPNSPVVLVLTVLNEVASLPELLDSVLAQTRQPDEVVVVDGGSKDGTLDVLERYRGRLSLTVMSLPGASISQGRNAAIRAARAPIVAVTDAGVRLGPTWLADLVEPFGDPRAPDVVAGFFRSNPRTDFELALGATILPDVEDIRPEEFLPSSRSVAFTRAAWERVGGYPEWLDYCEDVLFDLALRRAGSVFQFAPRAIAHFRPRASLSAFWRQYYRYARGDGKALLFTRRHAIRYATYLGGLACLPLLRRAPALVAAAVLLGALYCRRPAQRLLARLEGPPPSRTAAHLASVPLIRLVGDLAKMAGYFVGLLWRLRNRPLPPSV